MNATAPQSVPQPTPQNNPVIKKNDYASWRMNEKNLISVLLAMGAKGRGNEIFAEVVDVSGIQYKDFFERQLSGIWFVAQMLYEQGKDINLQTIWAEIEKGKNDNRHVLDTLTYLANQPVSLSYRTYAKNIVEASVANELKTSIQRLTPLIDNPAVSPTETLRRLYQVISDLKPRLEHSMQSETISIVEGLKSYADEYKNTTELPELGIATGFPKLDRKVTGWGKETLNLVVAPTGAGKSVFLMTSALHAVMTGKRVLFVQLEMTPRESMRRLLCAFAGINSNRLKRRALTTWEQERLPLAAQKLHEFDQENHFKLVYVKQPTLNELQMKLDALMYDAYDILFLDYAGGSRFDPTGSRNGLDLHNQIYNRINQWKFRYKIPVVAGAQYNYDHPQKHEGAYTNKMIFSSQSSSFNAHTVMFIHPPTPPSRKGRAEDTSYDKNRSSLVLTKIRDGAKSPGNDIIHVRNQFDMHRFVPMTVSTSQPMWEMAYNLSDALEEED